jgi:hypothetical protein
VDFPETKYARTLDGVHIAYQVRGDGPIDLIYVAGWPPTSRWISKNPGWPDS